MRLRFRLSVLGVTLLAAPAAAQRGAVVGRVTDKASGAPLPAASVVLAGTSRGTITGSDGRYRILNLPAGAAHVRVLRLGFESATLSAQIADGVTDTIDFALVPSVVTLDQVVVSASGEQQRARETGNAVSTINPDSIAQPAVADFSDLLNSRAAGVDVTQQSGSTGGGSRIKIRGSNSVSLSNDPLLVIDGVRVDNSTGSASINLGTGGQLPSRFDDLNPDEIENVQVLKGPAASALYGTAGSNGVIVVTTKHGVPGKTEWNSHAEYGSVRSATTYPPNYVASGVVLDSLGHPTGQMSSNCILFTAGQPYGCNQTPASLVAFTPFDAASPFVAGWRESYGLNAAGGNEGLTYFLSVDDYNEQGVNLNNRVRRTNLRANFHSRLSPVLDAGVNVGYLQSRLTLPQNDNSLYGILGLGLLGNTTNDPVCHGYYGCVTANLEDRYLAQQSVDRFTTNAEINYHPVNWFTGVANGGLDLGDRFDNTILPADVLPSSQGLISLGTATPAPYTLYTYTANLSGIFKFDLAPSIRSTTTIGTQFVDEVQRGVLSSGGVLVPGTGNLEGATSLFTTTQADSEIVTFGGLGSQEFAWRDKVFLTAAVRADESSAFGAQNDLIWYPDFSGSWVIGEEPWFPKSKVLSSLRLRAAVGESGQRPAFRQAETFYESVSASKNGGDIGGLTLAGIGSSTLKPEVSREYEGGLDLGLLRDRINVQFTAYSKLTNDALVQVTLPPSACGVNTSAVTNFGTCLAYQNLGSVLNNGVELAVNGTIIDTRPFRFDMGVNGSENNNKLLNLGLPAPILFDAAQNGNTQEHIAGHPLGVFFAIPYTFKDLHHNGIITPDDITLGTKPVFLGSPFPKGEWTLDPGFTFFNLVRVSSTFDRRYGSRTLNFTEEFRCFRSSTPTGSNCRGAFDPHAPLAAQAAYVAAAVDGTDYGYIENNAFWKWRELALTLIAPPSVLRVLKLSSLNVQLAERNVATWTHYTGYDPELNFTGTNTNNQFYAADFTTQPIVRYFTMRVNLGL